MVKLRPLEESDIAAVVDMGREMLASSSFSPMSFAPEKVAETIRAISQHGFAVVADDGGVVVGAILGEVTTPWFSNDRMGTERGLYVHAGYRGGRAAPMLVSAWTQWCLDNDAVQVRPAVSTGSEGAQRLYEGLGFKPVGALYVMDRE